MCFLFQASVYERGIEQGMPRASQRHEQLKIGDGRGTARSLRPCGLAIKAAKAPEFQATV